jgi:pentapeptide MXKDX repeat protein
MESRMTVRSRLLLPVALAFAFAVAAPAAYADDMSKDNMSKGDMKKDSMSKDHMSKDHMKKDNMSKDNMSKDNMSKYLASRFSFDPPVGGRVAHRRCAGWGERCCSHPSRRAAHGDLPPPGGGEPRKCRIKPAA